MLFTIDVPTREGFQILDITDEVQKKVWEGKLKHGIVVVFTKHTTTGLMINEPEEGLLQDFKSKMKELVPKGADYLHDRIDHNAHSHLRASLLLNSELVIPVDEGELLLGTWQRILFVELDGPRHRRVLVMLCPCQEYPEE
ncbi:secondary thiamine-phosphate synthase enzyme YjbQ [Thermococcus sp. Bubb.Bath]|uniref:secondary thiamine-phosphate synthase enzyme YjbQ n=1 Tax=Thermococcus sp. Bubb.Bath TaxID=1638242 RepID=UPI00143C24FD|nr:secondary thiamine-phosphate synthase enzyme YjbQ [Thermococcus sp. Bubb.Bath]NJF25521.1 YjbQ family protein [Thermococcus sp. Bubb.Bath]